MTKRYKTRVRVVYDADESSVELVREKPQSREALEAEARDLGHRAGKARVGEDVAIAFLSGLDKSQEGSYLLWELLLGLQDRLRYGVWH